ncbi:hypothetical protein CP49_04485 [Bradyrhizobium valentinum]|uniref:Uncharacterized protein n=1 Tax=Bradyrhizobium valentinum TaxID=1518501 RepID=A0A0R3L5K6_9BRAD|nr:hypothetical protein CP49_04485 [Bradyrhizobium valentinum]
MERQLILVFFGGIRYFSRSRAKLEKPLAVLMTATDLLRVINSKLENFTSRIAVRPRAPLASQWPQTLSTSGCSSAASVWLHISMSVKMLRPFILALAAGPIPWNFPRGRS